MSENAWVAKKYNGEGKSVMRTVEISLNDKGEIQGIAMWHIIDGTWKHLCQADVDTKNITFYTDGVEENFTRGIK